MPSLTFVLLVDDDQIYLDWMCSTVRSLSLEPVAARNFSEAAELLERNSFELVVTDNNMDGNPSAGVELLQYINHRLRPSPRTILHSSEKPKDLDLILEAFPWARFLLKERGSGNKAFVEAVVSSFS